MNNQSKINTLTNTVIISIMTLGLGIVIFNPSYPIFRFGTNYAVQIMFAYLFVSIGFLMIKEPRLLFTGFACTAALAMFLQHSANPDLVFPKLNGETKVSVAQFNLSAAADDPSSSLKSILSADVDVISLQEITPDWQSILKNKIAPEYPYYSIVFRPNDFLGVAIFSKQPFESIDTLFLGDAPNLIAKITKNNQSVFFASTYFYPEINDVDTKRLYEHTRLIANYFKNTETPIINLGEFNQVQWASFTTEYKFQLNFQDSRRFPFFSNPTDHIFFSKQLNCVDFKTISNQYTNHLGIKGEYQIKMNMANVEKKNR